MARTMIKYDLEERTYKFAKEVRSYTRIIPVNIYIHNDIHQLLRSSGLVGANYIEANNALSKKDFLMRIKICLKEIKETLFWLNLICNTRKDENDILINKLIAEAQELRNIFSKIISTSLKSPKMFSK